MEEENKNCVSVIITVYGKKVNVPLYIAAVSQALLDIAGKQKINVNFEIIFVTNNPENINVEEVDIFPKSVAISIYTEKKQSGKAILITKAVDHARFNIIAVMDADVKLPKSSLIKIIKKINKKTDVISTFHKKLEGGPFYEVTNSYFVSIQKNPHDEALFFTKQVWETIRNTEFVDSTFTIEVLHKTIQAGFKVNLFEINQEKKNIQSRFGEIKKIIIASFFVLLVKLKKVPIYIHPADKMSMLNAGVRFKKKKFITHSTLSHRDSAIISLTWRRILLIILGFELLLLASGFNLLLLAQILIAILSVIYIIDVIFYFYLIYHALNKQSDIRFEDREFEALKDNDLPIYSILCPLYKEAHMLERFLQDIDRINWPKNKLDVILLLEEDDTDSIHRIKQMNLKGYVRTLVVPNSQPKTKPKACNYGLAFTKGEYVVVYDAEDIPDQMQLKKAYIAFRKSDRKIVCLQAKLNYYNSNQNILTRFFTAEYSWLFDINLPGLQSLNTIIPLGGTSNHFRTEDLRKLHGWDSFNVTEDADLGLRIFRSGNYTAIIDSVTLEEANSNVLNWIRQRSRWIKGYMQTYLVHSRQMIPFIKEKGIQALMLHFVVGAKILFIFLNPIFWIITISYFVFRGQVGVVLEQIFSPLVLYLASVSLIFGNYMFILGFIFGCIKREQWGLIKYIYFIPFYLLLISVAGGVALYQLFFKPYYWEKTNHGLVKVKQKKKSNLSFADINTIKLQK